MVSWVWDHFEKIGSLAICKQCKEKIKCKGSSTSGLSRHLKSRHNISEKKESQPKIDNVFKTKLIGFAQKKEKMDDLIVKLIAEKMLPLNIVETKSFRELIHISEPNYIFPSRNTIKSRINEKYSETKDKIKEITKNI
jgi:hypothetical protein